MLLAVATSLLLLASPAQDSPQTLFNGVDLEGWSGDPAHWSVEDGCIVGRATAEDPLERSIYLFSDRTAADFVLEFEYRIEGGNSGVQYRSLPLRGGLDVMGYQADIEDGENYSGILYESNGRGIVATRGQRLHLKADGTRIETQAFGSATSLQGQIHRDAWNRYRIVAKGARTVHEINGVRMVDVLDRQDAFARSEGQFALQLHQGPPMEVRFRNFLLRPLAEQDDGGLATFPLQVEEPLPGDLAQWIWGPSVTREDARFWFRLRFELEEPVTLQAATFTCDNGFEAWLDGEALVAGNDWFTPVSMEGTRSLAAGVHVLAIEGWNEGGPAGLSGRIEGVTSSGKPFHLKTDESWQVMVTRPESWPRPAEEDAGSVWETVTSHGVVGGPGIPWGNVMAPRFATPVDDFTLPEGFQAELIYSARESDGSWASMTFGPEGEIYVSPQRGKLLRFRFPDGHHDAPVVEHLQTPVHSAQGLLFAYGSLYASVAGNPGPEGDGGLHRLRDLDGDGTFEQHALLSKYGPASEHGAHGIVLGPDGMLYTVIGNHTGLPRSISEVSPYRDYREDVLLPRIWDPRGHAHGMFAPAGVVMRTDRDGLAWEVVAGGMRNAYDLAFGPDGSLFTYDSDMEWDIGTPWYRNPRVIHVIPGGEAGWRSGSAKWPAAYPDSLPAVVETGPASPVGIAFATTSAFPPPWNRYLFLGDWAYGRITAVSLAPNGATFRGTQIPFLAGKPLNVTDFEFGPDGALWFTTGGRGTQSGLYRVSHPGTEAVARSQMAPLHPQLLQRRALEQGLASRAEILKALGASDRVLRYAARLQLEADGAEALLALSKQELTPLAKAEVLLALARNGEESSRMHARAEILDWDLENADPKVRWLLLRTAMLLRTRGGLGESTSPDEEIARHFRSLFPTGAADFDQEIARLLVAVEGADLPAMLLPLLLTSPYQEEQLHYALLLRLVKDGWSDERRVEYLRWLRQAHGMSGGFSLKGFLDAIEKDALAPLEESRRESLLAMLPPRAGATEYQPSAPRPFRNNWTVNESEAALAALADVAPTPERLTRGKELFRDLGCIACHRFGREGGSLGPDLSAAGHRFGRRDLLEAILEPAKDVSDQYTLVPMPSGLLDSLSAAELADFLLFLETGPPQ